MTWVQTPGASRATWKPPCTHWVYASLGSRRWSFPLWVPKGKTLLEAITERLATRGWEPVLPFRGGRFDVLVEARKIFVKQT